MGVEAPNEMAQYWKDRGDAEGGRAAGKARRNRYLAGNECVTAQNEKVTARVANGRLVLDDAVPEVQKAFCRTLPS